MPLTDSAGAGPRPGHPGWSGRPGIFGARFVGVSSSGRRSRWIGLVTAALVLSPPAEELVQSSLALHMVQHVVVLGVVAPLVALGSPAPSRPHGPGWLVGGALAQTAVVLAWHAPPLFDAAERTPPLHILEHLLLFAGAWLLWWAAARASGPAGWGPGALAVFVSLLPLTVLGVGMTFASTTWYSHHDDLLDQQLGGVVMWAGGGVLALVGAVALGVAWIGHAAGLDSTGRTSDPHEPVPSFDRRT